MSTFCTRLRLKALKPIKLPPAIPWGPTPYPMPASPYPMPGTPWPAPTTNAAKCPRCGMDWSGPMNFYCPICMGVQCSTLAA